jgi:hypothetical protein
MTRMAARVQGGLSIAFALGALSCVDGYTTDPELSQFPPMSWTVTLSPRNVVPPVVSPGSGTATLEWNGTRIRFVINVQNMVGINGAHIHAPASPTENADIVLHLFVPFASTRTVNGELTLGSAAAGSPLIARDDLAAILGHMRDGRAYLMVHTDANMQGEIRGQVVRRP